MALPAEENMGQTLVAPVGRSRLNLIAAVQRVQPEELILITSNKASSDDPALELWCRSTVPNVHIINAGPAHDHAEVVRRIHASSILPAYDTIALLSGSTNPIAATTWLRFGGRPLTVRIDGTPPRITSQLDGEHMVHSTPESDMLSIHEFHGVDSRNAHNSTIEEMLGRVEHVFGSCSSSYSANEGCWTVTWELPSKEFEAKRMLNSIAGIRKEFERKFGAFLVVHVVRGLPDFQQLFDASGRHRYEPTGDFL